MRSRYAVVHPGFAQPHVFRTKRRAIKFAANYCGAKVQKGGCTWS